MSEPHSSAFNVEFCLYGMVDFTSWPAQPVTHIMRHYCHHVRLFPAPIPSPSLKMSYSETTCGSKYIAYWSDYPFQKCILCSHINVTKPLLFIWLCIAAHITWWCLLPAFRIQV